MPTLIQVVERLRENGRLPKNGAISVRDLQQRFQPTPLPSTRALLLKMLDQISEKRPWAVILCRFQGSPPNPATEEPVEQFYRGAFTPGTGGFVEYWRDVSLGVIDITGSRVFGWVEVEIPRDKAGGTPESVPPGPGRSGLINYAINAVKRSAGNDALNGFLGPIAVYTQNWSKDGAPVGADWSTPGWFPFWIDGSADGSGRIGVTPPHNGNITAHEMGHVFGMHHDVGPDLNSDYMDPCCVMSQNNPFLHPTWQRPFGPAVCLPHLLQKGWMYAHRVYFDDGGWLSQPTGITLPLAPIDRPGAHANLGIKLTYKSGEKNWDYYLEYVRPTTWNQAVNKSFLIVRRMAPKYGGTPAFLGLLEIPGSSGQYAEFLEGSGNVKFRVTLTALPGPIIQVTAQPA